jgi:HPt (histidine-containing phosphotransfer) domain-containing protein
MNDFITKPFEPSELFAVLARWLPDPTQPILAAPAEPGAPVNFDAGLRRCLGRQDLYVRILRRFTESSGPELAALQGWLQGNDAGPLRDMAHSLISTAGTIGADALSQAARALQAALAEGNSIAWAEPVRRLAAEHAAALTAVHGWLRDFEAADAPNKPDLPAGSSASI